MPGCIDDILETLEYNLQMMPYVSQLLEIGYSPEKIVKTIARGLECDIKETLPVSFVCCSKRDKIWNMLATIDKGGLEEMSQEEFTEVHCQFCNETYKITAKEIKDILEHNSWHSELMFVYYIIEKMKL